MADPNAIPPVPIEPLMIDSEAATEMEEAAMVPQLNGGTPAEQLRDALSRVASSQGSPEAKAEMFTHFASQISVRSDFTWRAASARGNDGSYIFVGPGAFVPGRVNTVVISPQGRRICWARCNGTNVHWNWRNSPI